MGSREETCFFYLVDLLPPLPTYMQHLKLICQGEVCKIHKSLNLPIKTLKNITPRNDGKDNNIFSDLKYLQLI